jgi:hypothetical protein
MMSRMDDWRSLTEALTRTMRTHAPGWTDHHDADPGRTMLELMAYLAEGLRLNEGTVRDGRSAALRVIAALADYEQSGASDHWCGPRRVRFFAGRVLTADDLNDEQAYHREKHRRHVRALHGHGVVHGLRLTMDADGTTLTVEPGLAIDSSGNELCLADTIRIAVPEGTTSPAAVSLHFIERPVDPVEAADGQDPEPSRIEEGARVVISACGGDGAVIGQIVRASDGWRPDRSFAPPRAR